MDATIDDYFFTGLLKNCLDCPCGYVLFRLYSREQPLFWFVALPVLFKNFYYCI